MTVLLTLWTLGNTVALVVLLREYNNHSHREAIGPNIVSRPIQPLR